jgi:hypothetical protein
VAGNAEDEIGERMAGVRETELLYGPQSLLAIYGPMLVHVCGSPQKYKVRDTPLAKSDVLTRAAEPDTSGRRHAILQQIPLRQLAVL